LPQRCYAWCGGGSDSSGRSRAAGGDLAGEPRGVLRTDHDLFAVREFQFDPAISAGDVCLSKRAIWDLCIGIAGLIYLVMALFEPRSAKRD